MHSSRMGRGATTCPAVNRRRVSESREVVEMKSIPHVGEHRGCYFSRADASAPDDGQHLSLVTCEVGPPPANWREGVRASSA